jgi:hypothetical protein
MTTSESRRLAVGDAVRWTLDDGSRDLPGRVVEVGESGVRVRWADGREGIFLFDARGFNGLRWVAKTPEEGKEVPT